MQGNIVVDFKNKEDFVNGFAYFELNQQGQKYFIKMEKDEENKVYTLPIKSSLSKYACKLECQITIRESDTETAPIFKSNIFYLYCNEAINAIEEIPDQYPLWFEEVNNKIANIGNVSNLQTTDKTNLVNAINECVSEIGDINSILDNINGEVI